jgi:hypothetical protein
MFDLNVASHWHFPLSAAWIISYLVSWRVSKRVSQKRSFEEDVRGYWKGITGKGEGSKESIG